MHCIVINYDFPVKPELFVHRWTLSAGFSMCSC
jgi:superfamily II DNA/RNA helicase